MTLSRIKKFKTLAVLVLKKCRQNHVKMYKKGDSS